MKYKPENVKLVITNNGVDSDVISLIEDMQRWVSVIIENLLVINL